MALIRFAGRMAARACLLLPTFALAAGVSVRFDPSSTASPDASPFPSDRYTRVDWTQRSFRRVNLPRPDCATQPSECQDVEVLNGLDGFNTQPRITVPFTGPIDPASVDSKTIFLVNLGDTQTGAGVGKVIGINQVVWHPASLRLSFESDQILDQHTRYAVVITTGVRDASKRPIETGAFGQLLRNPASWLGLDRNAAEYLRRVADAVSATRLPLASIASISVFTTQTVSADLQKINWQIKSSMPAPVNFVVGNGGAVRAVFPLSEIDDVRFERQIGTAPQFVPQPVPFAALGIVPGAVGHIAFGSYRSPDYRDAFNVIPATPTLTGQPRIQRWNDIRLQLFLPAGAKPARGWPVAIFGHGITDCLAGDAWTIASILASRGIATAAINVVGHGGGPLGTFTVFRKNGPAVSFPAGGRGVDLDGNGSIDAMEGLSALPPYTAVDMRDGLRQTAVDLMQLVRQVETGIDVDGDRRPDLDASHLYYVGQSLGGIYGTPLLATEASLRAAVINVAGGSIVNVARLSIYRPLVGLILAYRMPSLINVADPSGIAFDENIPLRNRPPLVDTVPGAEAIQTMLDRYEWAQQSASPVAYAAFIAKQPLLGNLPKPALFQIAKGDMNVPNPTSSALLRAGGFAGRTTYFRNDLAYAADPAVGKDPHVFLTNVINPATLPFAIAAQTQAAVFLASNGATIIDPDGAQPLFETPLAGPLPEEPNFIP